MKSFVFRVDGKITRFEIEYGRVDIHILTQNNKKQSIFKYQSTSRPESILKYFKRNAEVFPMDDYNSPSISDCVKELNEAIEYI